MTAGTDRDCASQQAFHDLQTGAFDTPRSAKFFRDPGSARMTPQLQPGFAIPRARMFS
jgi:hypothetical protein